VSTSNRSYAIDRGTAALLRRTIEQAIEIDTLERRLIAARSRRVALIRKCLAAGLTERFTGEKAGISGARVHQIRTKYKGK